MNFIKFPVASTNIFPIANTTEGGQLVTEYNLRSRESVSTDPNVKYFIGPSYVHSVDDFKVNVQQGSLDYFNSSTAASSRILEISEGRGVINGHYIESNVPINIDMVQSAQDAETAGLSPLKGRLAVGLKAMYSTEVTISGSILTEGDMDLYEGIQVVILPESEFILPKDSPTNQNLVKADILLATFSYNNGVISNITNNHGKCEMVDAGRITDIDGVLSKNFPSKSGLNPKLFYTLAGKFNPATSEWSAEWCDSTESIMVWDANVHIATTDAEINAARTITSAQFISDSTSGKVNLVVPHKQIDGMANDNEYYALSILPFPIANYETGTPGAVDATYTSNIKFLADKLNKFYALPNGKQKYYLSELDSTSLLPKLDQDWEVGDYVLIGQDNTVDYTLADSSRKPSTMYVVLPGRVSQITYAGTSLPLGSEHGIELSRLIVDEIPSNPDNAPNTDDPSVYNTYWSLDEYRGVVNRDYFVYQYNGTSYFYQVTRAGVKEYSSAIFVTGGVPLASENAVGGFINAPDTAVDAGYVYLDSKGYLRLRDYALLRSGTLAYQLGEDYTIPGGLDLETIQAYLDEFVNQRIVFPNQNQLQNSDPNRITVSMDISGLTDGELNIYELDSRFNTSICLKITATESTDITINISDCEKVQIDPVIVSASNHTANVKLKIYRSNVYYNASVFDFVDTMQDIRIWYERFSSSDPILSVEGMTISQMMYSGQYTENNVDSISDWSNINTNDYHFSVALQSITFSSDGYINGCGVLVRNVSTSNVQYGKNVVHDTFTLPQGPNLLYPNSRLVNPIKVSGEFISAYTDNSNEMVIQDTNFSLLTQRQTSDNAAPGAGDGSISFIVNSYGVPVDSSLQPAEWSATSFHFFDGKTAF